MKPVARINQRIDYALDNESIERTGKKKKSKKKATKPPRSADEARLIIDELYERNPLLGLTASMSALTGLRYSDTSWLKFSDFIDSHGNWVHSFDLCQQKTYNMRCSKEDVDKDLAYKDSLVRVYVNDSIKEIVEECRYLSSSDEFLFANSRSSIKQDGILIPRPMSIQSANWHHAKVSNKLKLDFPLGCHSWRKYFAKKLIKKGITIEKIRDLLGQSSLQSTNHYLSTFDEELAPVISEMDLFE
ncbi:hypothetical protein VA249_45430 (plasmid) [Vibrio alfacsensis]|uniref:tyrosine-type recombinase/integrase n=1 Tax=Vibrio alfacsensis TaxID=1074311 RepID=UPI001BED4EE5|nr:tyrosine-type recombinase/integrase [Vibrio alfacsensis]BBM67897.1 hypothetical protein VA249_45430 [Vibrio alfacsensis]